jgi:hypothetical protein
MVPKFRENPGCSWPKWYQKFALERWPTDHDGTKKKLSSFLKENN